jgi:HK97 gp10 family phage protein
MNYHRDSNLAVCDEADIMPRILTTEELTENLQRLSEATIPAARKAMMKAAANIKGKAMENCTPGKSPYYRAPYSDDNDPKRQPPHMRDVMYFRTAETTKAVAGIVGNPKSYARAVHDGTSRMKARPFILDAIKACDQDTRILLSDALLEELRKECE